MLEAHERTIPQSPSEAPKRRSPSFTLKLLWILLALLLLAGWWFAMHGMTLTD